MQGKEYRSPQYFIVVVTEKDTFRSLDYGRPTYVYNDYLL